MGGLGEAHVHRIQFIKRCVNRFGKLKSHSSEFTGGFSVPRGGRQVRCKHTTEQETKAPFGSKQGTWLMWRQCQYHAGRGINPEEVDGGCRGQAED